MFAINLIKTLSQIKNARADGCERSAPRARLSVNDAAGTSKKVLAGGDEIRWPSGQTQLASAHSAAKPSNPSPSRCSAGVETPRPRGATPLAARKQSKKCNLYLADFQPSCPRSRWPSL